MRVLPLTVQQSEAGNVYLVCTRCPDMWMLANWSQIQAALSHRHWPCDHRLSLCCDFTKHGGNKCDNCGGPCCVGEA